MVVNKGDLSTMTPMVKTPLLYDIDGNYYLFSYESKFFILKNNLYLTYKEISSSVIVRVFILNKSPDLLSFCYKAKFYILFISFIFFSSYFLLSFNSNY